jgi:hypothetical protein
MFSRRNADRKRGANGKTLKELQKQFGMLAKDGAGAKPSPVAGRTEGS